MTMYENVTLILAQADAAPAAPSEGEPQPAPEIQQPHPGEQAPETPILTTEEGAAVEGVPETAPPPEEQGAGLDWFFPFIWIGVLVLLILMVFVPQRRERKRRNEMLESLKKNDRVQTIGGVLGTVVEMRPGEIVLKVDETNNTRMRVTRGAIQSVVDAEKSDESD